MRNRIAPYAVALTFGSAVAALLAHACRHGPPAPHDCIPDAEPSPGTLSEHGHAPQGDAPPWTEEVHALLRDQLWELHEEARRAGRTKDESMPRPPGSSSSPVVAALPVMRNR